MWAFNGSVDVDSDVEMLLDLRSEASDTVKAAEKVMCFVCNSEVFKEICQKLGPLCKEAKELSGWLGCPADCTLVCACMPGLGLLMCQFTVGNAQYAV